MIALPKSRIWKSVFAVVALFILGAGLTARHGDRRLYPAKADGITVYVLNNGFHSDIALPADQVLARGGVLAEAGRAAGDKRWLVYGWGDAGFYTQTGSSAARVVDGLRALLRPGNPSVIRVFGVNATPDKAFADPIAAPIVLSPAGFDALARHMETSFTLKGGAPVATPVMANIGAFFQSREHFSIARLCNNWTADQLAAAGLPTTPMIDGLAPVLALDLRLRAGVKQTR